MILLHEARVVRLAARLVERGQLKSHEFIGVAIDSADAPSIMERAPILPSKFALPSCGPTILGAVGSIKEILFVVRRRCGLAHRATAVWCCAEPVKFPPAGTPFHSFGAQKIARSRTEQPPEHWSYVAKF